jgi:hypothetical protein
MRRAVRQPSVVSFHLPHDTTLGCFLLAPPISEATGSNSVATAGCPGKPWLKRGEMGM